MIMMLKLTIGCKKNYLTTLTSHEVSVCQLDNGKKVSLKSEVRVKTNRLPKQSFIFFSTISWIGELPKSSFSGVVGGRVVGGRDS